MIWQGKAAISAVRGKFLPGYAGNFCLGRKRGPEKAWKKSSGRAREARRALEA